VKRTQPTTLVIIGLAGIVVGLLTDAALAATGHGVLVPPVTLAVTLAVIAVIVVVLAWPIRRAIRGRSPLRMDPFRAARTAVLAKSCSIAGALVGGLTLGLLLFMLTRTVVGDTGSIVLTAAGAVGAGVLLTGGLLAEWFCTIPPSDDDDDRREPPTGATHSHA
jgi:hypothetical protein